MLALAAHAPFLSSADAVSYRSDMSQEYPYPGRRQSGDPWIEALADAAVDFWRSRSVDGSGARLVIADDLLEPGAVALARKAAKEVILDGRVAGTYLANARNDKYTVRGRRKNLQRLSEIIAHEVGHIGGLEHSENGGVMDSHTVLGQSNPASMQSLVRKLIPRNATPNAAELRARDARRREQAAINAARRRGIQTGGG